MNKLNIPRLCPNCGAAADVRKVRLCGAYTAYYVKCPICHRAGETVDRYTFRTPKFPARWMGITEDEIIECAVWRWNIKCD